MKTDKRLEKEEAKRAWWWEEVEPGYEFRKGDPVRKETDTRADEFLANISFAVLSDGRTYFRDTRWTPPVKPLKVGDVIETEEQAASLPVGTIAVSMANEPIRKAGINEWRLVNAGRSPLIVDYMMADEDDQIIYLPEAGGSHG